MVIKIAIVEDQPEDLLLLENHLLTYAKNHGLEVVLKRYSNGEDFLADWPLEFHFIFLDVMMKPGDGMFTAKQIRKDNPDVPIIFLTDNPGYSLESYAVHAADYLLKPATQEVISEVMDRLISLSGKRKKQILPVKTGEGLVFLNIEKIDYLEYKERKVWIYAEDEVYSVKETLQEMEKLLPDTFFRIHHAFLVNLQSIRKLQGNDLYIRDVVLPISKHRRKDLLLAMSEYLENFDF